MSNVPFALVEEGHEDVVPHRFGPWLSGVHYNIPLELIPPDGLFAMHNMEIGTSGEVFKRKGYKKHIDDAVTGTPTGIGVGKIRFSSSSEAIFYIAKGDFFEDVAGVWTSRNFSGFGGLLISRSTDNFVNWVDAFGKGFFTDQVNAPWKWSGKGQNIASADVSGRFTSCKGVTWFDQRVWWWNTNGSEGEIWWTDQDDQESIGANSFFDVKGVITAVSTFRNRMFVHTYDQVWIVEKTGNTQVPYRIEPSITFGAGSIRNVVVLPGGVQIIGRVEGFYIWDGSSTPQRISTVLEGARFWENVQSKTSEAMHIHGMLVQPIKGHVWCFMSYAPNNTTLSRVMIFDYHHNRWFGPYIMSMSAWAWFDDTMFTTGYDDGLVYAQDSGLSDSGDAIDARMETSGKSPDSESFQYRWHFARAFFRGQPTNAAISVSQEGPDVGLLQSDVRISTNYDGIGTFRIGVSSIAGSSILAVKDFELQGFGANSKIKLENSSASETFQIHFLDQMYTEHGIVRREA